MLPEWGKRFYLTALVVLGLVLAISRVQSQTLPTLKRETRVKSGDALQLRIYSGYIPSEHKFIVLFQDSTKTIDGDGNIDLASLGKVHVANLNSREIAEILEFKFKQFIENPKVTVIPLARVTLRGTFLKPGLYRVDLNSSFWELVKTGGGMQNYDLGGVYIQRKEEALYRDFEQAYYEGLSLAELGIESGDAIIAPRINRLTMETIMRYFTFGISMLTFYVTLLDYKK
jgi:protein involved in polysaccharide export with SLBB domain